MAEEEGKGWCGLMLTGEKWLEFCQNCVNFINGWFLRISAHF